MRFAARVTDVPGAGGILPNAPIGDFLVDDHQGASSRTARCSTNRSLYSGLHGEPEDGIDPVKTQAGTCWT